MYTSYTINISYICEINSNIYIIIIPINEISTCEKLIQNLCFHCTTDSIVTTTPVCVIGVEIRSTV